MNTAPKQVSLNVWLGKPAPAAAIRKPAPLVATLPAFRSLVAQTSNSTAAPVITSLMNAATQAAPATAAVSTISNEGQKMDFSISNPNKSISSAAAASISSELDTVQEEKKPINKKWLFAGLAAVAGAVYLVKRKK